MSKDLSKAAKEVLDLFGPLVQAMPELIKFAADQEKAQKHLQQVQADTDRMIDDYNKHLLKWDAEEVAHKAKLAAQADEAFKEISAAKEEAKELRAKNRVLTKTINDSEKQVLLAQTKAQEAIARAQAEAEAQVAQAFKDAQAHIAEMESATADAEKKLATAIKKLEDFKAKL